MIESINDPPFPSRFYKYRQPDIAKLEHILIRNELWAAKPTTFNDPFDCFPYIDLHGTYDEALAFIGKRIERGAPEPSRDERRRLAREIHKKGLGCISNANSSDLWRESINQFGVISLSEDCLNILMWSHYAANHSGVCIEFSTDDQPLNVSAAVKYTADRPIFRPLDLDRSELMQRILLHKADIWRYEKEWRHFRIKEGAGKTTFPPSAITSVIIGAAASAQFERSFRDLMALREMQVPIRRVRFDEKTFRLHID